MVETRRAMGRNKKAQPPILSHEFIIQNHGDIMSFVLMIFIVGLMFPLTTNLCSKFIVPQYNSTRTVSVEGKQFEVSGYRSGVLDLAAIFFYSVAWIVIHAIIQEYVIDKVQRKAKLSKVSSSKFTDSGHMLAFTIYSIAHASQLLQEIFSGYNDFKMIWIGYPDEHRWMSPSYKLFFILQISYWLHHFAEFYFQKMKKEEMKEKSIVSIVFIIFISAAYFMNFTRICLVLLFLEYSAQCIFHAARLSHFLEKKNLSKPAFKTWNVVFLVVRFASVVLAVMTCWYGLRQSESPFIDFSTGNFNTTTIRLNMLLSIVVLQLSLLSRFLSFHFSRFRESGGKKEKKKASQAPLIPKTKKAESEAVNNNNDDGKVTKRKVKQ